MITERQEKILNYLIKEYINSAEPISSEFLKKKYSLEVSPATIRNELQDLTEKGYITQPHTSAGRVPTEKGYRFFIEITFSGKLEKFPKFILREIESTKDKIERELQLAKELTKELEEISAILSIARSDLAITSYHMEEDTIFDILKVVGPSRITYKKNVDIMRELLKEFERF